MNSGIEEAKAKGGVCLRCGADEFRIDGYCSCECRDKHELEIEIEKLREAVKLFLNAKTYKDHLKAIDNANIILGLSEGSARQPERCSEQSVRGPLAESVDPTVLSDSFLD